MLQLVVRPGRPDVRRVDLRPGVYRIGRTVTHEVGVLDKSLSRLHAEVVVGETASVRDCASRNGTFVNGQRIERAPLHAGDVLRCGDVEILVVEALDRSLYPTAILDIASATAKAATALRPGASSDERLRLLLQVAEMLASPGSLDTVLRRILDLVSRLLDADRAAILLVDPTTGALEARVEHSHAPLGSGETTWSRSVADFARERGVAALFSDAQSDPRLNSARSIVLQSVCAAMAAPLRVRDQFLGVLYVDNRTVPGRFGQGDLEFVAGFANQAAVAIDNAMLLARLEQEASARASLQRFFPAAVIPEILATSGTGLVTVDTDVTALFCDITGFTELSARLPPRSVVALLNAYFPIVASAVFRHGGTLEKYIGDALLAVWGAPFSHADDADRAVQAAIDMQRSIAGAKDSLRGVGIHIGMASGPVAAGNIGSPSYLQYATIGDTTNVASRVSGAARDGEIVIDEATRSRLTAERFVVEALGPTPLKGKVEPVVLHRIAWNPAV